MSKSSELREIGRNFISNKKNYQKHKFTKNVHTNSNIWKKYFFIIKWEMNISNVSFKKSMSKIDIILFFLSKNAYQCQ